MKNKSVLILLYIAAVALLVYFFIIKKSAAPVTNVPGAGTYPQVPQSLITAAQQTPATSVQGPIGSLLLAALQNSGGAPVPIATT
jgi:hypothetical protein